MKAAKLIITFIALLFFNNSKAAVSDSVYHIDIKRKYLLKIKSIDFKRAVKDTIPDGKVLDSTLLQKVKIGQSENDTIQPIKSDDEILDDETYQLQTKLSNKNLLLSFGTSMAAFFVLLFSRFLGPLQFLGFFGFLGFMIISLVLAQSSFKYSKIKMLNFFIAFWGVVVSFGALLVILLSVLE
jgi:hypothetical protein